MNNRNTQKGITAIGMVFACFIGLVIIVLAVKIIPVYSYAGNVKRAMVKAADDNYQSAAAAKAGLKKTLKLSSVDDLRDEDIRELKVINVSGKYEYSMNWSRKVPLVWNISLYFDFETKSN
ncbi:DUF4845 domain-containing protein [Neisseria sp. Ec49-e6-T10]|uniref:DUF4845 domain-containing protein n=1 Tax=Neisseria sp. Ec49-e6-T10 TaxID=3140744 RepID=UPI003EBDD702